MDLDSTAYNYNYFYLKLHHMVRVTSLPGCAALYLVSYHSTFFSYNSLNTFVFTSLPGCAVL